MKKKQILAAMNFIDDAHILSAQKWLEKPEKISHLHAGRTLRRVLAVAAAIALLTATLFTTAMAVSEDFRELVFAFFHVEQAQVIPETPVNTEMGVEEMFVEPVIDIGGVIEGRYVHTPVSSRARGGVYLVCTDEVEMRQGSHYDAYYEENGEFIRLEEQRFERDYTLHGWDIHVEFEWAEHNGRVHMTWADANEDFRKPNEAGDASGVLFEMLIRWEDEAGETVGAWYPVLLNLHTGELTDVLAGTGAEGLPHIDNSAISGDHTKMLLGQNREDGYLLYYVDLITKQMHSVNSLSGEEVDACSLIGDKLACWRLVDGYYRAWNIDLNTFERTELFDQVPQLSSESGAKAGIGFLAGFDDLNRWGDMYAGSSFALMVDEGQAVYALDLATGVKTKIEGYVWHPNIQRTPSPDGKKLLLAGGNAGEYFEYVGVLDFEKMTLVEFSREREKDVWEYLAYWFDENTVLISSEVFGDSLCSDYYLYSLKK